MSKTADPTLAANHVDDIHLVQKTQLELARDDNIDEHSLTVREAIRKYPGAVFWSVAVSGSIIMEGYDVRTPKQ